MTMRTRIATGLAALLLVAGMTGVAVASDDAVPGDVLYEVDVFLEDLGVGDGGPAERVAEAQELLERGEVAAAAGHAVAAAEAVESEDAEDPGNASEALSAAAESVLAEGDDASLEVRTAVASMLEEMARLIDEKTEGREFGETVSEMARQIGGPPDEGVPTDTPADDQPAPPDPGPPEGAGDEAPPTTVPVDPPGAPAGP